MPFSIIIGWWIVNSIFGSANSTPSAVQTSKLYWGASAGPSFPVQGSLITYHSYRDISLYGWSKSVFYSPSASVMMGYTGLSQKFPLELSFDYLGRMNVVKAQSKGDGVLRADTFSMGLGFRWNLNKRLFNITSSLFLYETINYSFLHQENWNENSTTKARYESSMIGVAYSYPWKEDLDFIFEMSGGGPVIKQEATRKCQECTGPYYNREVSYDRAFGHVRFLFGIRRAF